MELVPRFVMGPNGDRRSGPRYPPPSPITTRGLSDKLPCQRGHGSRKRRKLKDFAHPKNMVLDVLSLLEERGSDKNIDELIRSCADLHM